VAFCYSNHVDETAMTVFLHTLRDSIGGPVADVIFISDDADVYSNAWHRVMDAPAFRLLCTWHVDRAWKKN